jgi:hypothetical protein
MAAAPRGKTVCRVHLHNSGPSLGLITASATAVAGAEVGRQRHHWLPRQKEQQEDDPIMFPPLVHRKILYRQVPQCVNKNYNRYGYKFSYPLVKFYYFITPIEFGLPNK